MRDIEKEKVLMANRVKKLIVADNMPPLNFKKKDKKGFVEYLRGIFIRDAGSDLMHQLGVTCLNILVKYDTEIPAHEHSKQCQLVRIKHGKLFDIEANQLYQKGDCFSVNRRRNHRFRYYANSEYVITFQPNLIET